MKNVPYGTVEKKQVVAMYHIMKYFLQVVSDDGKKVRRAQPFTERHKEELQVSTSEQGFSY